MTEEQARAASMPTEDDFTHYFNATARLSAECERLRAALKQRDEFLHGTDNWDEFVESLHRESGEVITVHEHR